MLTLAHFVPSHFRDFTSVGTSSPVFGVGICGTKRAFVSLGESTGCCRTSGPDDVGSEL